MSNLRGVDEYGEDATHECERCGFAASGPSARDYLKEVWRGNEAVVLCFRCIDKRPISMRKRK